MTRTRTSVAVHALNLHNLTTDYSHLPQPPAWRIDRFGIVGELFPATDALGIEQLKAWSAEFGGHVGVVEPEGREAGSASVDLPGWGAIVRCALLGKRAEAGL